MYPSDPQKKNCSSFLSVYFLKIPFNCQRKTPCQFKNSSIARDWNYFTGKMPEMDKETQERLEIVLDILKVAFHYGYIPFIIYLGWTHGPDRGAPAFSLTNFLWYY